MRCERVGHGMARAALCPGARKSICRKFGLYLVSQLRDNRVVGKHLVHFFTHLNYPWVTKYAETVWPVHIPCTLSNFHFCWSPTCAVTAWSAHISCAVLETCTVSGLPTIGPHLGHILPNLQHLGAPNDVVARWSVRISCIFQSFATFFELPTTRQPHGRCTFLLPFNTFAACLRWSVHISRTLEYIYNFF